MKEIYTNLTRKKQIHLYVNDKELKIIKKNARDNGFTVNAFLRELAIHYTGTVENKNE